MLEVVKNFMDVPRCVFIIACDYEVVQRGVKARLGIDERDKAEAFFHKLIQVPFSMPSASYRVEKMLEDYFKSRGVADPHSLAERVHEMVGLATGTNPRSFKRYLNRVDLHALMGGESAFSDSKGIVALTGLVALQFKWPEIAALLAHHHDNKEQFKEIFDHLLVLGQNEDELTADVEQKLESIREKWKPDTDIMIRNLSIFMTAFHKALKSGHREEISIAELDPVIKHASHIGITTIMGDRKSEPAPSDDTMFYDTWTQYNASTWQRCLAQIAQDTYEKRRAYKALQVARSRAGYTLKTKQAQRTVMAFYEAQKLYIYLGVDAKSHFETRSVTAIADDFRGRCDELGVEYGPKSEGKGCTFSPQELDDEASAGFQASLLDAIARLDTLLTQEL